MVVFKCILLASSSLFSGKGTKSATCELTYMNRSLVFSIFVALLAWILAGCGSGKPSPAIAIEGILNKCAAISTKISGSGGYNSQKAEMVVSEYQAVDTRDCPEDFRIAYQRHVSAWQSYATASANWESTTQASATVNESYKALVEIAIHYGAKIPRSIVK